MATVNLNQRATSLNYNDLSAEIRLKIIHCLLESPRVIDIQPPIVPPFDGEEDGIVDEFPSPRPTHPVTLHINRESRHETLRFYKLAVQAIWSDDRKFFQIPTETAYEFGPHRNTEPYRRYFLCYDPTKDVFNVKKNFHHWFHHFSKLNVGVEKHIQTIQIEENWQSQAEYYESVMDNGEVEIESTTLPALPSLKNVILIDKNTSEDATAKYNVWKCALYTAAVFYLNHSTDRRLCPRLPTITIKRNGALFPLEIQLAGATLQQSLQVAGLDDAAVIHRICISERTDIRRVIIHLLRLFSHHRGKDSVYWETATQKLGPPLVWKDAEMGIPKPFPPMEWPCPLRLAEGKEIELCGELGVGGKVRADSNEKEGED